MTEDHAHRARPQRVSQQASFTAGLTHARAWAAGHRHRHLAVPGNIRENNYPLGSWLTDKRQHASDERLPRDHIEALNGIDPCSSRSATSLRSALGRSAADVVQFGQVLMREGESRAGDVLAQVCRR
ncbi:helicase associated domain-containing protein [Streptomyces sp. NPDC004752]